MKAPKQPSQGAPPPPESTTNPTPFLPARAKLCIGSLDDPKLEVRAQYNPKELQLDKQIPWEDHKTRQSRSSGARSRSEANPEEDPSKQNDLEFNGAPKRSMAIELLFDTYEQANDKSIPPDRRSVEADIRALEEMSSVVKPKAGRPEVRRPHHCVVTWGSSKTGIRPFRCVIESLAVKYTMWDHAGTPVRATCTVRLKEALKMTGSREPEEEYGEKRRPPDWNRKDPYAQDSMDEEQYMAELARKLNRREDQDS